MDISLIKQVFAECRSIIVVKDGAMKHVLWQSGGRQSAKHAGSRKIVSAVGKRNNQGCWGVMDERKGERVIVLQIFKKGHLERGEQRNTLATGEKFETVKPQGA